MSALTLDIDSRARCLGCWWWIPLPLIVFRRLDIHLVEKVDDVGLDRFVSLLVVSLLDGSRRLDDVCESMVVGASIGGDGRKGDRVWSDGVLRVFCCL